MKKIYVLILAGFLVFGLWAAPLEADSDGMNVFINAGVVTDDSFSFSPFIWTAGLNLDIHLGEMLMLSPEALITVSEFSFDPFWLSPAVLLNVKLDSFFVGGGLTKWFLVGDEDITVSTDVALKLNAGLVGENYRLTAFAVMEFDNLFSDMIVGVTIGFRF